MSKEMWIAAWDEIFDKLLEDGYSEHIAQLMADARASDLVRDRFADHADYLRKRAKEEA